MKACDLVDKGKPTIFIVGKPGCGKTALTSQAGEGAYVFDFDGKMRTTKTLLDRFTPLRQAVEFDTYSDEDPFKPTAFVKAEEKLREFIKKPPKAFVVDSITGLADAVTKYCMYTLHHDPFGIPSLGTKGQEAGDFTHMVNTMEKFLTMCRSVKCMFIATAHDGFVELPGKGVIHIINSITRNHGRNKIAWYAEELLFMTVRNLGGANNWHYFLTGRSEDLPCRTCSSILDSFDVTEEGLPGLLKKMQYSYDFKPVIV